MTELSTTRALKPHVTIVEAAVQIPTSLVVVDKRHESSEAPEKYGRYTHGGTSVWAERGRPGRGDKPAWEKLCKVKEPEGAAFEDGSSAGDCRACPSTPGCSERRLPNRGPSIRQRDGRRRRRRARGYKEGATCPHAPNRCEGCPDPPSNKLPIREHDLYVLDGPIIVAFLCPDCVAVDEGDDSNAKRRLRTHVKKQRDLESQSRQERVE